MAERKSKPLPIDRRTAAAIADREHQFSIVGRAVLIGTGLGLVLVALVLGVDRNEPSGTVTKTTTPKGVATDKTEVSRGIPQGKASVIPQETTTKTTSGATSEEKTTTTSMHSFESTETILAIGGVGVLLLLAGVFRLKSFKALGAEATFGDDPETIKEAMAGAATKTSDAKKIRIAADAALQNLRDDPDATPERARQLSAEFAETLEP
jgi:hypothetical protein